MNAYKKYKNRLEQFLQTARGKRFINFAYSFGAAIVILGAMFKLLHFPFGNEMLFIGMATECIVFILSAFDTPIHDYRWEQVFPALNQTSTTETAQNETFIATAQNRASTTATTQNIQVQTADRGKSSPTEATPPASAATRPGVPSPSDAPGEPYNYETVSSQTEEYGKQMENLNRTLSGLNSIYEIQLKGVSSQIGAIEDINRGLARLRTLYGDSLPDGSAIKTETEKMAEQLRELNEVYSRMLNAMTPNRRDNP